MGGGYRSEWVDDSADTYQPNRRVCVGAYQNQWALFACRQYAYNNPTKYCMSFCGGDWLKESWCWTRGPNHGTFDWAECETNEDCRDSKGWYYCRSTCA